jgi:hypothetical protein
MEHVKVMFDPNDIRDVLLDGTPVGKTETVLMVASNYYNVRLSGPPNFDPASQGVLISGTMPERPLIVTFKKVPGP